jgi:multisubunit Na+/H+ antiporter MnhG subunit
LFISENGGLFGFIEPGYSLPVVLAIVTEAAALLLLAPVAMTNLARASRGRARPPVAGGWPAALDGRQAR